jgi:thiol-disulfide isomerase/thioredoxin
MRQYGFLVVFLAVVTAGAWLWFRRPPARRALPTAVSRVRVGQPASPPVDPLSESTSRLHVLAINGGSAPRENYLSHLQHLQGLVDLLHTAGVPAERITVLAGDGSDPTPDLAVRVEPIGAEYWRLRGTPVEGELLPRLELGNSSVTGATLYPATRGSLSIWTLTVGQQLHKGDTLLLYVTDHGSMGDSPEGNRIVLWGGGQGLSVKELRETLETLDPSVRVVALMSQCFSGGFATLLSLGSSHGEPSGRFCGYFSAQERDRSYGCYPETRDDPKVGHSFAFLHALPASAGDFALAHELVVERDDTPDQPNRTSDLYLHRLLEKAALQAQVPATRLAGDLLRAAWGRTASFQRQAQHLDHIAARYGLDSPRSQADVDETRVRLVEWRSRLDEAAKQIEQTLQELNREVFRRFLSARASWQASLAPAALKAMDANQRQRLGATLVVELARYSRDDSVGQTQTAAKEMSDAQTKLAFRLMVRLAALGRMQRVLDAVAARQYVEEHPSELATLDLLLACEKLVLPLPKEEWAPPASLPALADDLAQAEMIVALTSVENRAQPSALRLGEPLAELNLAPYRGQVPTIGTGQPLLLFFWATWCKPCKEVIPELMSVAEKRHLTVVAIAHESTADLDRFFTTSAAASFPALVVRDPEARAALRLGLRAIPSLLLLDGQGKVASNIVHSPRDLPAP